MINCTYGTSPSKKGFTLIELLVVIAIIAILAAILFPVFAKAREKARQASCQSNLKQIGIAILQYVQDYDEMYPGEYNMPDPHEIGWRTALAPYVKSTGVYMCPSNTKNNLTANYDPGFYVSYAPNPVIMEDLTDNPSFVVSSAKIAQPTATFIIGESTNQSPQLSDGCDQFNGTTLQTWCKPDQYATPLRLFAGHSDMSNWLFCDGHVKTLRPTQTCNATTDIWMVDYTWSPAIPCDSTLESDVTTVEKNNQ